MTGPKGRLPGVAEQVTVVYVCGHTKDYDAPEDEFDAALMEMAAGMCCPECQRLAAEINEHTARIADSRKRLQEAMRDA